MQETRYDGSEKLTEAATLEDFHTALADKRNASVALHKPGSTFMSNGRMFQVNDEGKLSQLRKQRRRKNRAQKAARKRNRR